MKKTFITIAALAILLVGIAGQAIAYFEEGHLVRVVYDRDGVNEIVTDLGAGYNFTSASTANQLFSSNNFSLSQLGIPDWSNAYVAYFTVTTYNPNTGSANGAWASGPTTGQSSMARKWASVTGAWNFLSAENNVSGVAQNVNLQANTWSYKNTLKQGTMNGLIPAANVDANLGSFNASGPNYVDQILYYYSSPNVAQTGAAIYKIRTYDNGTTEINPVPVPAAIYLLGTGLLALVGIRRKTAVEA